MMTLPGDLTTCFKFPDGAKEKKKGCTFSYWNKDVHVNKIQRINNGQ